MILILQAFAYTDNSVKLSRNAGMADAEHMPMVLSHALVPFPLPVRIYLYFSRSLFIRF